MVLRFSDYIKDMFSELKGRLSELFEQVLRIEPHRLLAKKTVELSELARGTAAVLQESEPERQVEFIIQEGVVVEGDAHLLRAVLQNLLGNAWKFTSKHSRARIEFGALEQQSERAYFVRDDGAGFDMAYADKLFGAFQRMNHQHPVHR